MVQNQDITLIQNINPVSWYIVNNDIQGIKSVIESGDIDQLDGANQYGDSYYTIANRLGYSELASILKEYTKVVQQGNSDKISPIQVFYDHTGEGANSFYKAFEYLAFHPILAKIMIPVALDMYNKNDFVFAEVSKHWEVGANKFGLEGLVGAYIDFSSLKKQLEPAKNFLAQNSNNQFKDDVTNFLAGFYLKYNALKAILYNPFVKSTDSESIYKFESVLIHEITHSAMGILFNNEQLPYSKKDKNVVCLNKKYKELFQDLIEKLSFILENLEDAIPDKVVATTKLGINGSDNTETITFSGLVIKMGASLLQYSASKRPVEAVVLYPQAIAEGIKDKDMTIFASLKSHFDDCIFSNIDRFAYNHLNCHVLRGIGACNEDGEM